MAKWKDKCTNIRGTNLEMSDRWIRIFKKDKAFMTAFVLNLVISVSNVFIANIDFFIRTFGVFFVLLIVIVYKLIDTIDRNFEETFYLNKINSKNPENFKELLEKSANIDLLGIHLNSFFQDYIDNLKTALNNGSEIRVLIVATESSAIKMTSDRYAQYSGESKVIQEAARLNSTHDTLRSLLKKYPKKIKVKEVDYLFEHELVILNSLTVDSRYNFGTKSSSNKPKFFYKPDTEWYKFCQDEFKNHWDNAKDVTNVTPTNKR